MSYKEKERRGFRRVDFPCKIYVLTAPLRVIKCRTENIGAGGIRVLIDEELPVSSLVGLEIYLSQAPVKCKGRVVWVVGRKISGKKVKFDTGIEFRRILESDRKAIAIFIKSLV